MFNHFNEFTVETMQYEVCYCDGKSASIWKQSIVNVMTDECGVPVSHVCMHIVSVRLHAHLKNHMYKLHLILSACYLWL